MSKSNGSYYTPQELSTFIWDHALKSLQRISSVRVLEPSCGDGVFLQSISELKTDKSFLIDAVEIDKSALVQAQKAKRQINGHFQIQYINDDFLSLDLDSKYDLVVGNPPYVGRKFLSDKQKELCRKIHLDGGLSDRSIRNIWTAFLVKASLSLNSAGVLALVLPGELLQVRYAEEIRTFLVNNFKSVEILTFQELVFSALGQDVVVIFAYKDSPFTGIHYKEVNNVNNLASYINFSQRTSNSLAYTIKWSNYLLEDSDLAFLSDIARKVNKISDCCTTTPGIVTGANDYFIINKETADKYDLMSYCKPIMQKASLLSNTVCLDTASFQLIQNSGQPCLFIDLQDSSEEGSPAKVQDYLKKGREQNIHTRYKCRTRTPWYNVPTVWVPEGVVFKRCHLYPKILKNKAQVLFTDSAYRISMRHNFDLNSLILSFYNSLTLVFCELRGRSYGGGVLELTPSEFQSLPILYRSVTQEQFDEFEEMFVDNPIEHILSHNDAKLAEQLGLGVLDLHRLKTIYKKLLARRLKSNTNGS